MNVYVAMSIADAYCAFFCTRALADTYCAAQPKERDGVSIHWKVYEFIARENLDNAP